MQLVGHLYVHTFARKNENNDKVLFHSLEEYVNSVSVLKLFTSQCERYRSRTLVYEVQSLNSRSVFCLWSITFWVINIKIFVTWKHKIIWSRMYGSRILHFFSTGFRAQMKITQNITFFEYSISNFAAIRQVGSGSSVE